MRPLMRLTSPADPVLNKRDLSSDSPDELIDGQIALHDGTGTDPEGEYWYDATNTQWVKVSTNDTGSSTTISLSL